MEYLFVGLYFLLLLYLGLTKRHRQMYYLFVASFFAFVWVFFAGDNYGYNNEMFRLFGLNAYPLFAWAVGLFIFVNIYFFFDDLFAFRGWLIRFVFFVGLYWGLLIFAETFWYHVLGVHNIATSLYAGLPVCDCMHAPLWMQVSYFAFGPVYFAVCEGSLLFYDKLLVDRL